MVAVKEEKFARPGSIKEAMESSDQRISEVHGTLLAMQKNLECSICLEVMKDPVSTNCAHIFCRLCMFQLLKQKKGVTQCPLCNAKVTKRSLWEDVKFKQVVEGVLEAIRAFEHDTGLKFADDQCFPKKGVGIASASDPQKEQPIIDSKGYRNRLKSMKEGKWGNTTLGGSSSLALGNGVITRHSLRKKRNPNKAIFLEAGSDSSEDLFVKAGTVRCVGFGSNSVSQDGERSAKKQRPSLCPVNITEPSAEDVAPVDILGACSFLEESLRSTEDTQGSIGNCDIEENVATEKNKSLSFPAPFMGQHDRKPDSRSIRKDGSCSLLSMDQTVSESIKSTTGEQTGNGGEIVGAMLSAGNAQTTSIQSENEEQLLQPQTSPGSPLSQVSGKKLRRSILKVNEWLSKSKEILPPSRLQDAHTEEVAQDLKVDSHISQKTEQGKDQGEFPVDCEDDRLLSKPVASKIVDKIFGRTYKRERKSTPLRNEKETVQVLAEKSTVVNKKSCDSPVRKILMRKRKATSELTSGDFIRRQDVEANSKRPGRGEDAGLEEGVKGSFAYGNAVAEEKEAKFPAESVKKGVSILGGDTGKPPHSSCNSLPESNLCDLKNLKNESSSLCKRSRRSVRAVSALQLEKDRNSRSPPSKADIQIDSYPSTEEPRKEDTGQMQIRRSKRLQLQTEEAWRGSKSAKRGMKQVSVREKKLSTSQAENMSSSSIADDNPIMLQDRLQKGMSWSNSSLMGMEDGNASKTCTNPAASPGVLGVVKGPPSVEQTTEDYSLCVVPNTVSQGSNSILQFHPEEVGQTTSEDKAAPQPEKNLCAQVLESDEFCAGDVMESCKASKTGDKAAGTMELNPETDDSELDTGFMRKIFSRCKRQSFLLHPGPMEESTTEMQRESSTGCVEGNKTDCVKKTAQDKDRIYAGRGQTVEYKATKGISVQSLALYAPHFPEHESGTEHFQAASQAPSPDHPSTPVQSANKNINGRSQLHSQSLLSEKEASAEMGGETANSNDSSRNSSVWRNDNPQGNDLRPINETSSGICCSQTGFESDNSKRLAFNSQPELMQLCPETCQPLFPEFSCIHNEKKSSTMEQKQLNRNIEQAIDVSSPGVPKCLASGDNLEQSSEQEFQSFPLLLETPNDLLNPATKSKKSSPNLWEIGKKDILATFAKTDEQTPCGRDLDDCSSSSKSKCKGFIRVRRRLVQKLPSSEEEDSSDDSTEDEELPCFQALIFGQTASTPLQPLKEREMSADLLAVGSSNRINPKHKNEDVSPSQESVNLFSSQSHASEDDSNRSCDSRPKIETSSSREKLTSPSRSVKDIQLRSKVFRDAGQPKDGHQEHAIADPNLECMSFEETMDYDSEASHLGDLSGLSSQSEILTTQQRNAMQNNLKELQQKMAILEAVLQQETQSAVPEGLPLTCGDGDFAGGQSKLARGSMAKLRSQTSQSLLGDLPANGSICGIPGNDSICSSKFEEQISSCLHTKIARGSPAAAEDTDGSSTQRHKAQRRASSSLGPTVHCSAGKATSKNQLLISKRNMALVASGLNQNELRLVQKFARKTESTWSSKITEETTHVVMKTDEELVCERTLKYFLGIAAQKWVVSYQWIVQSLKEGRVINEEDFEVKGDVVNGRNHQGPRRARESPAGKLFQGLEICCYGPFSAMLPVIAIRNEQMNYPQHNFLMAITKNSAAVVVVQPDAWEEDVACQEIPLQCSATVVTREWVLDSIACYQRQMFDDYIVQQV